MKGGDYMEKGLHGNSILAEELEEEDTLKNKYLAFTLGKEDYGIEIRFVTEIIGIQEITEVPELPSYVKGIINLRGKIIPVMDVRVRFKKQPCEYNDRTCIVVIEVKEISIGLIIDRVEEVLIIPEEEVVPPPHLEHEFHHRYIKGIGKVENHIKLLVDCERLLGEDEANV